MPQKLTMGICQDFKRGDLKMMSFHMAMHTSLAHLSKLSGVGKGGSFEPIEPPPLRFHVPAPLKLNQACH